MDLLSFAVFTIISSIEYVAIVVFSFLLFRIQPLWYKMQIAFVCLALSYLSYTMRVLDFTYMTPFVQLAVLIIILWLMFQIHPGYAALIGIVGYFAYGFLQGLILFLVSFFIEDLQAMSFAMYVVAICSSLVTFGIGYIIKRKNWGFSFVPHSDTVRFTAKKQGAIILSLLVAILFVGVVVSYYLTITIGGSVLFLVAFISLLLLELAILLIYSHYRETKEVAGHD